MIFRMDVRLIVPDTRAEAKLRSFSSMGIRGIGRVDLVDSYLIDAAINRQDLIKAQQLFHDALVEEVSLDKPLAPRRFNWAIEIGLLPGVTDNVGNTAKGVIEDFLKKKLKPGEAVYSSKVIFLSGRISRKDTQRIADSLYNPLIERATIKSFDEFKRGRGMGSTPPRVRLKTKPRVLEVNLEVPDDELAKIGKEGISDGKGSRRGPLALDLVSMKVIQRHFRSLGRKPRDIEMESLAQTWSEHCKHTIFADPIDDIKEGLYRRYIKGATNLIRARNLRRAGRKKDFCVSVFTDNSGAIAFDENYLITHKVETHNSPSALDPFGGAITGIVGVNRDTMGFGLGAKPAINLYGYCFADPSDKTALYRDAKCKEKMLSARRIMEGVIAGVNAGGNCSGIPTPQGFVYFDKRYRGKPLVFVGTVGIMPRISKGKFLYKKKAQPGDYVVMAGGRVGQDGIHGATFSSEAMDSGSPATAVQIGDPITQKKLSDVLIKEARDKNLYHSITDNGAGGLSCSVAEMARESGGCSVNLDRVPLKYPGLDPWQIWISESQERMTLAVPPAKWKRLKILLQRRGVEATVIGIFTDSGRCAVRHGGKKIMDIDLKFLHDGRPQRRLITQKPAAIKTRGSVPELGNSSAAVLKLLQRLNIASTEFISQQYDHEVQAGSVLKPLQGRGRVNAEATVTRPVLGSPRGVVLGYGLYPSYSEKNPYNMAACAIDTAIRTAVAAGGNPRHLALLDNFCWSSSNDPERLYQLKEAVRACYDYAVAYEAPYISGKDSMFNDFKGYEEGGSPIKISVPPTLLISSISVMPDATKAVSIDVKQPSDAVYVLGETQDELGGSEYAAMIGFPGGVVPAVNARRNKILYAKLARAIGTGLVASAVSVGRGGLAAAFSKMAMAGGLGLDLSLKKLPGKGLSDTKALFSESQGRIVITVSPQSIQAFEKILKGSSFSCIGKVTAGKTLIIRGKKTIKVAVSAMFRSYRKPFKNY